MYLIGAIKAGSNPLMPKSAPPHIENPLFITVFLRLNKIAMCLIGAIKAGSNPLLPKSAPPNLKKLLRN